MALVLNIVLPLFLIILSGYVCARVKLVEATASAQIIPIVWYVLLPAFIFIRVLEIPEDATIGLNLLGSYYLGASIVVAYVVLSSRWWRKQPRQVVALRALAAIAGVVGYMGLPLIVLVLGKAATLPALILVTADNLLVLVGGSILLLVLSPEESQGKPSPMQFMRVIFLGVLKNPLIIACVISLLFRQLQVVIPSAVSGFLSQLAAAAAPMALFLLGMILAGVKRTEINLNEIVEVIILKLLVFPGLVYVLGQQFGLSEVALQAAVIMAALPVAINVFILANKTGAYVLQASTAMFVSTCLSVLTLSGLLAWLLR